MFRTSEAPVVNFSTQLGSIAQRINDLSHDQQSNQEIKTRLEASLDAPLGAVDELDSFKLQEVMSNYDRMMQTLSNLMKSFSDTANSIVSNIK